MSGNHSVEHTVWMGHELGANILLDASIDPITLEEAVMINMIHRMPDIASILISGQNSSFYRGLKDHGLTREKLMDWGFEDE